MLQHSGLLWPDVTTCGDGMGKYIGFKKTENGILNACFCDLRIGRFSRNGIACVLGIKPKKGGKIS
jgi:hypothetical protein